MEEKSLWKKKSVIGVLIASSVIILCTVIFILVFRERDTPDTELDKEASQKASGRVDQEPLKSRPTVPDKTKTLIIEGIPVDVEELRRRSGKITRNKWLDWDENDFQNRLDMNDEFEERPVHKAPPRPYLKRSFKSCVAKEATENTASACTISYEDPELKSLLAKARQKSSVLRAEQLDLENRLQETGQADVKLEEWDQ